jgi:hypothetical protein
MKCKYRVLVAGLAVLLAGVLQGCAATKPCKGKLRPINPEQSEALARKPR